jgi:hypothetical protein
MRKGAPERKRRRSLGFGSALLSRRKSPGEVRRLAYQCARRLDGAVPALHVAEFVVAYSSSKVMRTRTSTVAVPASMGTDLADISMGVGDA